MKFRISRKQALWSPSLLLSPSLSHFDSKKLKEVSLYQNRGWVLCPTGAHASTTAICIFQQVQIPCSFLPFFLGWAGSQDESRDAGESEEGTGAPLSGWDTRSLTLSCPLATSQAICPDMEWKMGITY